VVGAGEIFGGGVAPSVAGFIAQHYGIQNILNLALGGVVCGILVCFFLKETAPRKVPAGSGPAMQRAAAR
jgi:fucose permease